MSEHEQSLHGHVAQGVEQQRRDNAAKRLKAATKFAALHATGHPLFSKRMGSGKTAVLVRVTWPGVLSVHDPVTGELLAMSEPGKPDTLKA